MEGRLAGSVVKWRVGSQGLRECGEVEVRCCGGVLSAGAGMVTVLSVVRCWPCWLLLSCAGDVCTTTHTGRFGGEITLVCLQGYEGYLLNSGSEVCSYFSLLATPRGLLTVYR